MLKSLKRILLIILMVLIAWISWGLSISRTKDKRDFDPVKMGEIEASMWRSYYERKPKQLFSQLTHTFQTQFDAPYWKSVQIAYYASQAAMTFQSGHDRATYMKALPYLESYYKSIFELSATPFNVKQTATNELEWWIIRRERDEHPPSEWKSLIAQIAASFYHMESASFESYAHLRVEAMLMRDALGRRMTDKDWKKVEGILVQSWMALHEAVH